MIISLAWWPHPAWEQERSNPCEAPKADKGMANAERAESMANTVVRRGGNVINRVLADPKMTWAEATKKEFNDQLGWQMFTGYAANLVGAAATGGIAAAEKNATPTFTGPDAAAKAARFKENWGTFANTIGDVTTEGLTYASNRIIHGAYTGWDPKKKYEGPGFTLNIGKGLGLGVGIEYEIGGKEGLRVGVGSKGADIASGIGAGIKLMESYQKRDNAIENYGNSIGSETYERIKANTKNKNELFKKLKEEGKRQAEERQRLKEQEKLESIQQELKDAGIERSTEELKAMIQDGVNLDTLKDTIKKEEKVDEWKTMQENLKKDGIRVSDKDVQNRAKYGESPSTMEKNIRAEKERDTLLAQEHKDFEERALSEYCFVQRCSSDDLTKEQKQTVIDSYQRKFLAENRPVYPTETKESRITSYQDENHKKGIDTGAKKPGVEGDPIFAAQSGKVIEKRRRPIPQSGSESSYVVIQGKDGITSRYVHSKLDYDTFPNVGDDVKKGQIISTMSDVGSKATRNPDGTYTGGVHLHYEAVDKNGKKLDALEYIRNGKIKIIEQE